MLNQDAEYQSCIQSSERVSWRVDDLLPKNTVIDFSRRILSDALIGAEGIRCLSADEKLKLNHIRTNSYAHLFLFLEEYVVALMTQRAGLELHGNPVHMRALLRFTEEELKHQQLFARYTALFADGFKLQPALLDNHVQVARAIMSKSPLAVLIFNLHMELMTQQHYVETIRGNDEEALDPLFSNLLKHHWMEEAQHARMDFLEAQKVLAQHPEALEQAMTEYAELLTALRGTLVAQLELDLQTLEKAVGRTFSAQERSEIHAAQERSYVWTFIGMGMKAPLFLSRVRALSPVAEQRVLALAPTYYCQ
ncbi:diiron oxygenase [Pyxidicoccus xibeiensis]|uniref:diiron oxygenase n=1 Tax=Pyxidicoccus xibeiensis TaxID=2906759 RepID=UPI0020A6E072|nr:diiron oxygenase [Pyxidicoccus xibeiensis]MCP3137852.1 diiron oxygenase [Pyxidicoccus xibeiensis]